MSVGVFLISPLDIFYDLQVELAFAQYARGGLSSVEAELDHRHMHEPEARAFMRDISSMCDSDHRIESNLVFFVLHSRYHVVCFGQLQKQPAQSK